MAPNLVHRVLYLNLDFPDPCSADLPALLNILRLVLEPASVFSFINAFSSNYGCNTRTTKTCCARISIVLHLAVRVLLCLLQLRFCLVDVIMKSLSVHMQLFSVDVKVSVRKLEQMALDLLLEGVVTDVDRRRIQTTRDRDVIICEERTKTRRFCTVLLIDSRSQPRHTCVM